MDSNPGIKFYNISNIEISLDQAVKTNNFIIKIPAIKAKILFEWVKKGSELSINLTAYKDARKKAAEVLRSEAFIFDLTRYENKNVNAEINFDYTI